MTVSPSQQELADEIMKDVDSQEKIQMELMKTLDEISKENSGDITKKKEDLQVNFFYGFRNTSKFKFY